MKDKKGMSIIMELACWEARNGNMDMKVSVGHMGNAFISSVEISQEEAACLVLQLQITRMRQVLFLYAAHPDEVFH